MSGPASRSSPPSFESILIAALGDPPVEPLPSKATVKTLRQAVAETLEKIGANDLAEECVRFGMAASQSETDDPWRGKYRYVMRRVRDYDMPGLGRLVRWESPVRSVGWPAASVRSGWTSHGRPRSAG